MCCSLLGGILDCSIKYLSVLFVYFQKKSNSFSVTLCKTGYSVFILTRVLISLTLDHKSNLLQGCCYFVGTTLATERILILMHILHV